MKALNVYEPSGVGRFSMVFSTYRGLLISLVEIRESGFSCLISGSNGTFLLCQVGCPR